MSGSPRLSIVVPVRLAGKTIRNTLSDLVEQCRPHSAEVIAVVAENDPARNALHGIEDPNLTVVVQPGELGIPQLRRDGVQRVHAPFVVIAEDHCRFPAGWLETLLQRIDAAPEQVHGGPVENGRRSWIGWAQYFSRYSLFMPPVAEGSTRALPGNNCCYPRAMLDSRRDLLRDGFWEAEFNDALLRDKITLSMCPHLVVHQTQHRGLFGYASLRFRHGRCYGGRRIAGLPAADRTRLRIRIPLIPPVLFFRAARNVFRKRRNRSWFLLASPLLLFYVLAWGAGESIGYFRGPGRSCYQTD